METLAETKKDNYLKAHNKFKYVMGEFGKIKLHDRAGNIVTDIKQANAIAFSQARRIYPEYEKKEFGGELETLTQTKRKIRSEFYYQCDYCDQEEFIKFMKNKYPDLSWSDYWGINYEQRNGIMEKVKDGGYIESEKKISEVDQAYDAAVSDVDNWNNEEISEYLNVPLTEIDSEYRQIAIDRLAKKYEKGGKMGYKSSRPSPSDSATEFEEGYQQTGNDGNLWEIKIDKNGVHSWKKVSEKINVKMLGLAMPGADYEFDFSTIIGGKLNYLRHFENKLIYKIQDLGGSNFEMAGKDFKNGFEFDYKGDRFLIFDNTGEFKGENKTKDINFEPQYFSEHNTIINMAESLINEADETLKSSTDQPPANLTYEEFDKLDQFEKNQEIRKITENNGIDNDKYSADELKMIEEYEGGGAKTKEKGARILDQFFTPYKVIEKMWGLATKYGFDFEDSYILEPAVGSGKFLKYIPAEIINKVVAYEIDKTAYTISKVLYPEFDIRNESFETMFFDDKRHTGLLEIPYYFDLVIGNPPYRDYVSEYAPLGEKEVTKAFTFDQYFLIRGIDILKPGGILIFIIPNTFLSNGDKYNDIKEKLISKADLIDAYRLPNGIFGTTDIGTDIVCFRKKNKVGT